MAVGIGGEQIWLCPSINDSALDQSGNGNDGTYTGGMGTVADTTSGGTRAYDFDGVDDYITSTLGTALGATVSFSCWIKFDVAAAVAETFVSNDGYVSGGWLLQRRSGGDLRYAENASAASFTDNTWSTSTSWHHVVSVRSGGVLTEYIDGVLLAVSTTGLTGSMTDTAFVLGRRQDSTSQYSDCKMDDVRAYSRVIAQAEIAHLATARGVLGAPPLGLGGEQIWLCPTVNDSALDQSGYGNDGTYTGGMGTVADTGSGGTRAYSFDGVDDEIDTGSTTILSNSVFTYAFWINSAPSPSGTSGVMGQWGDSGNTRGPLAASSTITTPQYTPVSFLYQSLPNAYNAAQTLAGTVVTYDSTWHHVVCEFDGASSETKIYVDGVLDVSKTASVPTTVAQVATLRFGTGSGGWHDGLMDDIRGYSRTLTQAEVTHLATARGVLGVPGVVTGRYDPFRTHAFTNKFFNPFD